MGQTTFDDDELLDEATDEKREVVREHLADARAELPTADAVWETDADNVLGALNGLSAALDTEAAVEPLRQARKEFLLGQQAGVFEEGDELGEELEAVVDLVDSLQEAHDRVGKLTSTVPKLRSDLQDAHAEAADGEETEA